MTEFQQAIQDFQKSDEVWGIYAYADIESGDVIYIGIDRHIDMAERHKDHIKPSKASKDKPKWQAINEYLVNHPNTWKYAVLVPLILPDKDLAQAIETELINKFKPILNTKRRNLNDKADYDLKQPMRFNL